MTFLPKKKLSINENINIFLAISFLTFIATGSFQQVTTDTMKRNEQQMLHNFSLLFTRVRFIKITQKRMHFSKKYTTELMLQFVAVRN